MDIVWQGKSVDLLVKLLTKDYGNIYAAPYAVNQLDAEGIVRTRLETAAPEELGVPSAALARFYQQLDTAADQNVHSLMVLRGGKIISQAYWQPYDAKNTQMLYSMSKSVTSTAIGMAVDEGLLDIDERLVDIFRNRSRLFLSQHKLKNLTVRHLLTMSSGITLNEVGATLETDWVRSFMEADIKFAAGSAFEYNSVNTYMLSAILQEKTGMSMMEYLKPRLFKPLGIDTATWEICPKGIEKGGWGLNLRLEDAAKLGQLYLQKGVWSVNGQEKRLLSEEWIAQATRTQIETPNGEMKSGYGYQIWMCEHEGAYVFNGAFGQYVVVIPDHQMVVAMFSGSAMLFAQSIMTNCIDELLNACTPDGQAIPEDPKGQAELKDTLPSLRFAWHTQADPKALEQTAALLSGRSFELMDNNVGLLPFILQCVHADFAKGCEKLSFAAEEGKLLLRYTEGEREYVLPIALDGSVTRTTLGFDSASHPVAIRATGKIKNKDSAELILFLYYLDTPNVRSIILNVGGSILLMIFDEIPSISAATRMLFELTGIESRQYVKTILTRAQEMGVTDKLKTIGTPAAIGTEYE